MKIGLVGTCTSGKSTIGKRLIADGYQVRQIAQEHSFVQDMWRRISNPDILIYLDVSFENTLTRRKLNWKRSDYQQQLNRLTHARQHADLVINTNDKTIEQVYREIHAFIHSLRTS